MPAIQLYIAEWTLVFGQINFQVHWTQKGIMVTSSVAV